MNRTACPSLLRAAQRMILLITLLAFAAPAAVAGLSRLHTAGTNIVDADGNTVQLRGLNLGGWLITENWMSPTDSSGLYPDDYSILSALDSRFGVAEEQSLVRTYQQSWIDAQDLQNIKSAGFNVVRVPVWWGDFFTLAGYGAKASWRPDAFDELDWLVKQCSALGIYVIIDMHGVVGAQSVSDDTGRQNVNQYWSSSVDQSETEWMWEQIARHYRSSPAVAGYDLINEPDGAPSTAAVWSAYASLYTAVRSVDPDHIVIIEGTFGSWNWSMLPDPSVYGWTNVVYEMHEYQWGRNAGAVEAGADNQSADFENHKSWGVPDYVGEFNDMGGGTACSVDTAETYDNAGIDWSMWAYKAIHGTVPDSWGFYDPIASPPIPNIATDSADTIASDWEQWTTAASFAINPQDAMPTGALASGIYTLAPACAPALQLAVAAEDGPSGTNADVATKLLGSVQRWRIEQTSGNMYRLEAIGDPGLLLDVSGAGTTDGTNVDVWESNATDAQQWFVESLGNGQYMLFPECAPNSCLDVAGSGTSSGANVDIDAETGGPSQLWTIAPG